MTDLHWCVPPIRWIQRTFLPPDSQDWAKVSFQPMLYTALWTAAVIVVVWGDTTNVPAETSDYHHGIQFWVWGGLSLICPPLALGSMRLIRSDSGIQKYRGLWLRLAADIGQFTALIVYTAMRLVVGDYHVYPVACLLAAVLFVAHLIMRDVKRLVAVERLAVDLHREARDGPLE